MFVVYVCEIWKKIGCCLALFDAQKNKMDPWTLLQVNKLTKSRYHILVLKFMLYFFMTKQMTKREVTYICGQALTWFHNVVSHCKIIFIWMNQLSWLHSSLLPANPAGKDQTEASVMKLWAVLKGWSFETNRAPLQKQTLFLHSFSRPSTNFQLVWAMTEGDKLDSLGCLMVVPRFLASWMYFW